MNTPIYQIFGSENSLDVDLVFFIEEMPETILEKFSLSKKLTESLVPFFPEKEINANLAVCKNGHLTQVYKGTTDELNNALFYTYSYHEQKYENQISRHLCRDVDLKFLRSSRMILLFVSKTAYRLLVKNALRGDINEKVIALETINLNRITSFGKEKNNENSIKSIAFQLGQTILLNEGKEVYTKNQIADYIPDLRKQLFRDEKTDSEILQKWLLIYVELLKKRIVGMKQLSEYKYEDENDFHCAK